MNNSDAYVYEIDFLYALASTVFIEAVVIYVLFYFFDRDKIGVKNFLLAGVLPSFSTLPYLWFVLPFFFIGSHFLYVVVGEFSVTLVEAFILFAVLEITLLRAFIYSVIANFCSYGIGVYF